MKLLHIILLIVVALLAPLRAKGQLRHPFSLPMTLTFNIEGSYASYSTYNNTVLHADTNHQMRSHTITIPWLYAQTTDDDLPYDDSTGGWDGIDSTRVIRV